MLLQLHLFLFTGRLIVMDCIVLFKLSFWTSSSSCDKQQDFFSELCLSVSLSFCSQVTSSCLKLAHAHKLQLQQPIYRTWVLRPNTGPYPRAVNRTWANVLFTAREKRPVYRTWVGYILYTGRSRARNGPFSTNGLKRTRGFLAV